MGLRAFATAPVPREDIEAIEQDLADYKAGATFYPEVETYLGLPDVAESAGKIYLVRTGTGTWPLNRKRAGLWWSDGVAWERLGKVVIAGQSPGFLPSNPPSGKYVVTNVYVDPTTGKLQVDYDDVPI